jgi:putative spermidine/putrescine transport system ATP-binding protein
VDTESFVKFVDIQKTYDGEKLVIKNMNLSVSRGEFLTLLGPSGSGKTTTLLMLAGFERPTSGRIEIEGRPLIKEPPYKRNFGMVFQDYALFPHMTVQQNIAFPLAVRKFSKKQIEERVDSILNMVRLSEFGKRYPGQLSGGQQQRVALARALVFAPTLVLMDEPLGALDKQLREQMQLEIKHIQKKMGITVVYVTHDQSEALTMSDRIAVFNDGIVCQIDTPEGLYERPQNSFVAQFIGENNQIPGKIVAKNGNSCEVELDGGGRIKALPVNAGGVGSRTIVSVRPERIFIDPPEQECENRFTVRIQEMIYKGEYTVVKVALDEGPAGLTIKMPVSSKIGQTSDGSAVRIGWSAADCRALDEPHGA